MTTFIWCVMWFTFFDEALNQANKFPIEQRATIQFISAPSQRTLGGWVGQPYGIVYRAERCESR